jgi:ubiquinone/menaquinone biosynthesis C-methylase UbiE
MSEDLGQMSGVWDDWWGGITPKSEIQMWDFYGGRQWITKYVPRHGKVVEAGCGVGRYVFYLKKLGIEIEGIDFSETVIEKLEKIKNEVEPTAVFIKGDVTKLPYEDNSLSGYISLGVVEHFIEGPQQTLAEAFRALRPGGIAIITTPNISFLVSYRNLKRQIKNLIKRIIGRIIITPPFFQYEYRPTKLKKYLEEQGFYVSRAEACDLLYPFCEIGGFIGNNLIKGKFAYWFSNTFENTWFKYWGGQAITISVKKAPLMNCFLSGEMIATPDSLEKFDVPISKEYQDSELAKFFLRNKKVKYSQSYLINPPLLKPEKRNCAYSGKSYSTDPIFEDFGFNKNCTPEMLSDPKINIDLSVNHIRPVWRKRKI